MNKILILQMQTGDQLIEVPVEGLTKNEFLDWFHKLCSVSYPLPKKVYHIKELGIRAMPQQITKEKLLTWEEWKKKKGGIRIEVDTPNHEMPFYGDGTIIM
jgi:hypothetical protein